MKSTVSWLGLAWIQSPPFLQKYAGKVLYVQLCTVKVGDVWFVQHRKPATARILDVRKARVALPSLSYVVVEQHKVRCK